MRIESGKPICLAVAFVLLIMTAGTAAAVTYNVTSIPGSLNHTTIQGAVNASSNGDSILVYPGTYNENVDVNKQLNITSTDGAAATKVIVVSSDDHVFEVTGDGVTISGFSVSGATDSGKAGIYLSSSSNNTLTNNTASNNHRGIFIVDSSDNTLTSNTASNNENGIYLYGSSNNNMLINNTANSNNYYGIFLRDSQVRYNTLSNNTALHNYYGIHLLVSSNNNLTSNTASNNTNRGIYLSTSSNNNNLTSNNVSGNTDGIYLSTSSNNNTLTSNTASNNSRGIRLYSSSNNNLASNTVSNNNIGIALHSSSNNLIYNNDFNNTVNTEFTGTNSGNIWNIAKTAGTNIAGGPYLGGNYWANPDGTGFSQTGTDADKDGICDETYSIASGHIDHLPLTAPPPITVDDDGSQDYTTIQAAVDNATAGDTILVYPGTYNENVDVDKQLNITSTDGAAATKVIAASSDDHVFYVNANGVTISGFNVSGATGSGEAGIRLYSSNNSMLINNNVSNNYYGIFLRDSSNNNTLTSNTASNNYYGIRLSQSSNNNLTSNTASNNYYGIFLRDSSNNTLTSNTANSNNYDGINLHYFNNNNTLTSNTASGNTEEGISLSESSNNNTLTSNTASNNDYGIILYGSSNNNTLTSNTASGNTEEGIYLYGSSNNNTLSDNAATSNNQTGIFIVDSSDNTLSDNTANTNKENGIWLGGWSNYNMLINNTANSNNDDGIRLDDLQVRYNTLSNNTALHNYYGIHLIVSSNNNLTGNTASNNSRGIRLYSSSNNNLTSNTMSNNNIGIDLYSSRNNHIYNNHFNNSDNTGFSGTNTGNVWNTTKTEGSNIMDGPYLGGNFWAKPDGTGFSQIGEDANRDGICDSTYNIVENDTDYLPLSFKPPEIIKKTSSSGGGGGGGGGGTTGEAYENIAFKDVISVSVSKDGIASYEFENEENPIKYIRFSALRNWGKISATIEVLHNTSSMVREPPGKCVCRNINIWVGKGGFATPENIENVSVGFKVEKKWVSENNINESTIRLNRCYDNKWNPLPTTKRNEDGVHLYFEAQTPGFSPFAITGEKYKMEEEVPVEEVLEEPSAEEIPEVPEPTPKIPTKVIVVLIVALVTIILVYIGYLASKGGQK